MDWLLLYEMLKPLGTRLPNLIDSIQPKHNVIPAQLKHNNQKKTAQITTSVENYVKIHAKNN